MSRTHTREHARFVFLHPRGAYIIYLFIYLSLYLCIYLFGGGGEESKNDRQMKTSHSAGAPGVSLSR